MVQAVMVFLALLETRQSDCGTEVHHSVSESMQDMI